MSPSSPLSNTLPEFASIISTAIIVSSNQKPQRNDQCSWRNALQRPCGSARKCRELLIYKMKSARARRPLPWSRCQHSPYCWRHPCPAGLSRRAASHSSWSAGSPTSRFVRLIRQPRRPIKCQRSSPECVCPRELDVETLVCSEAGRDFCGNRCAA
jgi:hypothetical protein